MKPIKKYLLFVEPLHQNDLKQKKINEINLKIPTVRRTVGSKWAKIQKGKQNKLKTLTVYIFTQFQCESEK